MTQMPISRKQFLELPVEERRRILVKQARDPRLFDYYLGIEREKDKEKGMMVFYIGAMVGGFLAGFIYGAQYILWRYKQHKQKGDLNQWLKKVGLKKDDK